MIKNTINNAAYSYAIAGVATGSHSSWRRGSPHPKMGMSLCSDREQAAAPPMRPWVRRSSRTCPRPHRTPVSHSGRGHRSGQDGVPSCCCYPPLAGIMKSAARLTPPRTGPLPAAPRRGSTIIPTHTHGAAVIRGTKGPAPQRSVCARAVVVLWERVVPSASPAASRDVRLLHRSAPHDAQAARCIRRVSDRPTRKLRRRPRAHPMVATFVD